MSGDVMVLVGLLIVPPIAALDVFGVWAFVRSIRVPVRRRPNPVWLVLLVAATVLGVPLGATSWALDHMVSEKARFIGLPLPAASSARKQAVHRASRARQAGCVGGAAC